MMRSIEKCISFTLKTRIIYAFTLEKLYYTGQYEALASYLDASL